MARIIVFIAAAVALFFVFWLLFTGLMHLLVLGFWVLIVLALGFGMFKVGRWSRARSRE
jgi:hypothetical protein